MTKTLPQPLNASANDQHRKLNSYRLNAKQSLVIHPDNWANDVLFGGAKGGGKSFLFRYLFAVLCVAAPGVLTYLLRRTYDELWGNHMEGPGSFPDMLSEEVERGECAIVNKEVRWKNGSRIFLRHMQLEKHKYNFQGREMHAVAFDEATQFTETQIRYALMSVRFGGWQPKLNLEGLSEEQATWIKAIVARLPLWLFGANPGGPSHDFIKERYVDLGPYEIKVGGLEKKDEGVTFRQFIPARAEDNPELMKNDPLYLERLEIGGDPLLVKAMREGDWSIVAGSMFGAEWRPEKLDEDGDRIAWHVCAPKLVPLSWPLWRGGDDGFAKPSAIYHCTQDPDTDTIYVINEIYAAGLTAPELAERIKSADLMIKLLVPGENRAVYNSELLKGDYDSNAFAQTGRTSEISRGEQMNRLGCNWKPVQKWPGSRVARVQHLHKLLLPNPKERGRRPGIVFFNTCVNAIRTIPKLMRDEADKEDIAEGQEDHGFDGVTYATQHKRLKAGRAAVGF